MRYTFDASAGRFTVQAFPTGLLSAFGHNPTIAIGDFDGQIQSPSGSFEDAVVQVTVRTSAMEVLDQMKAADRQRMEEEMLEKVLDVKRFPAAEFTSRTIRIRPASADLFQALVEGELSFHGVTHEHALNVQISRVGTGLRIWGDFTLRQSDYGVNPICFAGGALRLKDELKFKFEVLARKEGGVAACA